MIPSHSHFLPNDAGTTTPPRTPTGWRAAQWRAGAALVSATLALFALSACGERTVAPAASGSAAAARATDLPKIILQTDWYAQPEHGGFYQALERGYYKEAGIDVEIAQGGPNALTVQKVALGQAQFAVSRSDEIVVAATRGIPVVMVGALMQRDPQAIVFHEESGIRGFKDLDGRNLMAQPGANWITLMERKFAIKVLVTPLDFGLSRFLADKKFVQQCFITNEPYHLRKLGAKPVTLLLTETGFSPYRVWFTSRDFIAKHPDAVRAFTTASIRGWRDYLDGDRQQADAMISALNKQLNPGFIAYSVAAMREHQLVAGNPAQGEAVGRIDPARIATEIAQLLDIGVITAPPKVADVFDDRFLPDDVRVRPTKP